MMQTMKMKNDKQTTEEQKCKNRYHHTKIGIQRLREEFANANNRGMISKEEYKQVQHTI